MSSDNKLLALRKSYEVQEGEARESYAQVEKVYEERLKVLQTHTELLAKIEKKIEDLKAKKGFHPWGRTKGATLESAAVFQQRLQKDKEPILKKIKEAQTEVDRAQVRLERAHEDLVEVRIELKKIDKIIGDRATRSQIKDAAREEISTEEMNFYRRRK